MIFGSGCFGLMPTALHFDMSDKWSINIQFKTPVPCLLAFPAGVLRGDRIEIRSPIKTPAGEATCLRKFDQFFEILQSRLSFISDQLFFFNSSGSFCAIKCTNQPNFSSFIGRTINSILFKRWFYLTFWKAGRADIFDGQILFYQFLSAYSWLGNDFLSQLYKISLRTLRGIAS